MEETTVNRKSPIIIGIAGGTGSGKSTFTNRLKDAFGDQVTVLYHDNYYRAHDDMPFEQRKKLNYDHPDAFETELLLEHLNKLKNWEAIDCPTYNYANHNRAEATIHIEPRQVILLEGILVLSMTKHSAICSTSAFSSMPTPTSASSAESYVTRKSADAISKTSSIST